MRNPHRGLGNRQFQRATLRPSRAPVICGEAAGFRTHWEFRNALRDGVRGHLAARARRKAGPRTTTVCGPRLGGFLRTAWSIGISMRSWRPGICGVHPSVIRAADARTAAAALRRVATAGAPSARKPGGPTERVSVVRREGVTARSAAASIESSHILAFMIGLRMSRERQVRILHSSVREHDNTTRLDSGVWIRVRGRRCTTVERRRCGFRERRLSSTTSKLHRMPREGDTVASRIATPAPGSRCSSRCQAINRHIARRRVV
jgi:hypothetical protein